LVTAHYFNNIFQRDLLRGHQGKVIALDPEVSVRDRRVFVVEENGHGSEVKKLGTIIGWGIMGSRIIAESRVERRRG
jgi:hypothetical protein